VDGPPAPEKREATFRDVFAIAGSALIARIWVQAHPAASSVPGADHSAGTTAGRFQRSLSNVAGGLTFRRPVRAA
jgi:hypothetical protein